MFSLNTGRDREVLQFLYNPKIINAGEDVEKREPFYNAGGNVNWCGHYEKQYGGSLRK